MFRNDFHVGLFFYEEYFASIYEVKMLFFKPQTGGN